MNVITMVNLMKPQKCPQCKTKFDGLISLSGKYGVDLKWKPNAKFLFHYEDTHGFPHEMLVEYFDKLLNQSMTQEKIDLYDKTMKEMVEG